MVQGGIFESVKTNGKIAVAAAAQTHTSVGVSSEPDTAKLARLHCRLRPARRHL